jgi:hypothetical protein
VLAAHSVPAGILPADDLRRPITSFAVSADNSPFLVAYYDDDGSGLLSPVLHILRYDERTRDLRRTDLHGPEGRPFRGFHDVMWEVSGDCMGSALAILEKDGFITIDTHINPSAGCVLVLASDLSFNAGLWGWALARINGEIIFEESTIHFASTHPARLSIYDPRQRQMIPIYPAQADAARQQFSADLRKHLPSSEWCAQQNNPCDPQSFTTDIDHLLVREQERSFAFDARMDAYGFGEDAVRSVQPKTIHYVCRQSDGKWILSSAP